MSDKKFVVLVLKPVVFWGGFPFTMFPCQEPGGRGPPSKNSYQVLRGGSLLPGS